MYKRQVAHTALTLLKGLGAQTQTEPFARETDFMKQLQAGNISGAATILANQAEGSIAGATTLVIGKAEELTGVARGDIDPTAAGLSDIMPPAV